MPWSLIITLIIQFMPYILKWLEKLFDKAAAKMCPVPESPSLFRYELEELFNQAESEMSWWQFLTGKRAVLRTVRRIVLRRSDEFLHAAKTNTGVAGITPLTPVESDQVSKLLATTKKR